MLRLISAGALLLSASVVFACPDKGHDPLMGKMADGHHHASDHSDCKDGSCPLKKDLVKKLGLSGDKAEQVKALQASFQAERKAIKKEKHDKMAALKKAHMSELSKVLSAEELEKVEGMVASKHHGKPKQCGHKKKGHSH